MSFVDISQVGVGVEMHNSKGSIHGAVERPRQGDCYRMIATQEKGQRMSKYFQSLVLYGPKVTSPLQVGRHVAIISHLQAQRLPLLGARGQV
jgi:hypothetical protein